MRATYFSLGINSVSKHTHRIVSGVGKSSDIFAFRKADKSSDTSVLDSQPQEDVSIKLQILPKYSPTVRQRSLPLHSLYKILPLLIPEESGSSRHHEALAR